MAAIVEGLLPDVTGESRHGQVTLDTWFDRLIKALTVWLPLLVSGTLFLGDFIGEPQNVICYPPSNVSIPQANYVNAFCKENLDWGQRAVLLFPKAVLSVALLMYVPHLSWKIMFGTEIASQINFISKQIDDIFRGLCEVATLQDKSYLRQDQRKEKEKKETVTRHQVKEAVYHSEFEDQGKEREKMETLTRRQVTELVYRPEDQRKEEENKERVTSRQLTKSLKVFTWFVDRLICSKKLWKLQIGKMLISIAFLLLSLLYLGWFNGVSQNDNVFFCPVKIRSNNESRGEDTLGYVCEITGVQHLYPVSIFLSISFCIAFVFIIFFFWHIISPENNFLAKIIACLDLIISTETKDTETAKPQRESFSTSREEDFLANIPTIVTTGLHELIETYSKSRKFTDFAVIGHLCGENRHLIESPHKIISTAGSHIMEDMERLVAALFLFDVVLDLVVSRHSGTADEESKNIVIERQDGPSSFDKKSDDDGASSMTSTTGSRGNTFDVEADIHHHPPTGGSLPSTFHTEDENRLEGLAREETLHHRGSKNKSNSIEKETSV